MSGQELIELNNQHLDNVSDNFEQTGYKDKNGVDICKGHTVKHNANTYLVKYSENQKAIVLRIVNDPGMNWRSMDWLSRVCKYCEVLPPRSTNKEHNTGT